MYFKFTSLFSIDSYVLLWIDSIGSGLSSPASLLSDVHIEGGVALGLYI